MPTPTPPRRAPTPIDHLNALVYGDGTADGASERWRRYYEPVPALSATLPVPVLGIMVLIWQLRDQDLQRRYPLADDDSRLGFIGWCIVHGWREYGALREAAPLWRALAQPADWHGAPATPDDPGHALSWLIVLACAARPDLGYDLGTVRGRGQLLLWYLLHGRHELAGTATATVLADWQIHHLLSASSSPGLNRLQQLVYQRDPELARSFPLPAALPAYIAWFRHFISVDTDMIEALRGGYARAGKQRGAVPAVAASSLPGVNVIGYAYGQFGIAEDARMALHALLAAGVPAALFDFAPDPAMPQADRSMAQHVSAEQRYDTNLFCLSALEHGRAFAELGSAIAVRRYNIGYWPWELSAWPEQWKHLLALVDEVWVSSGHTRDALAALSPVPVRLMPMAVEVPPASARGRADFGLPPHACLFLFAFDLNSSANRKNPAACVQAFLAAFPDVDAVGAQQVGLVVKVHPPARPNRAWNALRKLQRNDRRIHLIEQTLNKPDLLALYQACDCFLSLHRAEGFGRCIAEAMLCGKPVIATGYSGNLSFTNRDNALLVDYALAPLAPGAYPYGAGQHWAEPDIADAARRMRELFDAPDRMAALAARGQRTIVQAHRPHVIGHAYALALARLRAAGVPS